MDRTNVQVPRIIIMYYRRPTKQVAGQMLCRGCGEPMGDVSHEEIDALLHNEFSIPVCMECEKWYCRVCDTAFLKKTKRRNPVSGGVCWMCQEKYAWSPPLSSCTYPHRTYVKPERTVKSE